MPKSSCHPNIFNTFSCRTKYFKSSFFPSVINDWNNLDPDIRCSRNYSIFHKSLHKHKFRHNFKDRFNPFCLCSIEPETTRHFFLRCHFHNESPAILINYLENINQFLLTLSEANLPDLLLHGNENFNEKKNYAKF